MRHYYSIVQLSSYFFFLTQLDKQLFHKLENEDKLVLSGFGFSYDAHLGKWYKPANLQMTDELKKLPITHCIDQKSTNFFGHFCAGDGKSFEQNGEFTADSCNGDSGGPLTFKDPYTNRFHLVGLGMQQYLINWVIHKHIET